MCKALSWDKVFGARPLAAIDAVIVFTFGSNTLSGGDTTIVVIGEVSEGGSLVTVWLASNGYVAGSSAGQIVEYQAGRISNISAQSGTTVGFDRRLVTAVS